MAGGPRFLSSSLGGGRSGFEIFISHTGKASPQGERQSWAPSLGAGAGSAPGSGSRAVKFLLVLVTTCVYRL